MRKGLYALGGAALSDLGFWSYDLFRRGLFNVQLGIKLVMFGVPVALIVSSLIANSLHSKRALDAVELAFGVFLFPFGVVLILAGLSTPEYWGSVVYGVVLSLIGAAVVGYSAAAEEQTPKS